MRIVNAVWEKKNLGVNAYELSIETGDNIDEVKQQIENIDGDYIVIKVPSDLSEFNSIVQELGFLYIEDLIHVEHDLKEVERNRIIQRLYDETTYREMTDEDFEQLITEIKDGMFDSDRISNDPHFGKEKAANRYINWSKDLRNKGARFYAIRYRDDSTGFVVLDTKDQITYSSILGGGYQKYRKSGIGIIQKEQEITKDLGGKRVVTTVSSNNVGQFKALIMNGYKPYSIEHVFVKHI
ncbi:MAG: hypothetical protein K6E27_00495 [Eubacterium sp.]|nr:hypothetical protein [Eubacterium sp.]